MKNFSKICLGVLVIMMLLVGNCYAQDKTPRFGFKAASKENRDGKGFLFKEVYPGDTVSGELSLYMLDDITGVFNVEMAMSNITDLDTTIQDWTTFEGGNRHVLNGVEDKKKIKFDIQLPEVFPPGDYRFLLFARLEEYGEQADFQISSGGGAVKVYASKGILINMSVPGERYYDVELLSFKQSELNLEEGLLNLTSSYINKSNSVIYPSYNLVVENFWGEEIFSKTYEIEECIAAKECDARLIASDLKIGYIDKLKVRSDLYYKKNPSDPERIKVGSASLTISIVPIKDIVYGVSTVSILIIVILFFVIRRAWYRRRSVMYLVKEGDSLESVCEKQGVKPKRVIIANKLKAPYFLKKGTKIYLPK